MKNVLIPLAIGLAAGVFLPTLYFFIFIMIACAVLLVSTVMLHRKDKS